MERIDLLEKKFEELCDAIYMACPDLQQDIDEILYDERCEVCGDPIGRDPIVLRCHHHMDDPEMENAR